MYERVGCTYLGRRATIRFQRTSGDNVAIARQHYSVCNGLGAFLTLAPHAQQTPGCGAAAFKGNFPWPCTQAMANSGALQTSACMRGRKYVTFVST